MRKRKNVHAMHIAGNGLLNAGGRNGICAPAKLTWCQIILIGWFLTLSAFAQTGTPIRFATRQVELGVHSTGGMTLPSSASQPPPVQTEKEVFEIPIVATRSSILARWHSVPGALGYRLDVSLDGAFGSYVAGYRNLDVGSTTGVVVTGLTRATTYYYRVRPYNLSGLHADSDVMLGETAADTGLIINPVFDSSVPGAMRTMIMQAVSIYESLFSDPVTISIYFRYANTDPFNGNSATFVGQSYYNLNQETWTAFINALKADGKTGNDATANASLPASDFSGGNGVKITTANGRALGFNTPATLSFGGTVYDGVITLNSNSSFQFTRPINGGNYDALAVTQHEIDEVMGLGSINGGVVVNGCATTLRPMDVFSWSSANSRSVCSNGTRYFSINSGSTNIVAFNQIASGDLGDWVSDCAHYYVQNANACPGQQAVMDVSSSSPEGIALDVVGYDVGPGNGTRVELLSNGGFEASSTGWTINGNAFIANQPNPHTGVFYAYLGNADNAFGNLFNTNSVTIPANAISVTLSFWLNITSQETENVAYDVMNVSLLPSSGGSVPVVSYSNLNKDPGAGNPYYSQRSFDLTAFRGQTLKVYFDATTDPALITTFRIDDISLTATLPSSPTKADFNSDGKSDLVWQSANTGQAVLWFMDGQGNEQSGKSVQNGASFPGSNLMSAGDLNSDGKSDLMWQDTSNGQVYVWFMDGQGNQQGGRYIQNGATFPGQNVMPAGDLNGDGKSDIMWQNASNGQVYIWFMDGQGNQQSGRYIQGGATFPGWRVAAAGDLNGDGKSDIMWQNTSNGQVYIWFMDGQGNQQGGRYIQGGATFPGQNVIAGGDLNSDGKSDLIWQNASSGQAYIWFMDGQGNQQGGRYVQGGANFGEWKIKP
jgi:hypothetical protein